MRRPSPGITPPGMTPPLPEGGQFVGQAVEMNAATGRISQAAARPQEGEIVHNMVTMEPNRSRDFLNEPSPSSEYSSPGAPKPLNMAQPPDMISPSSMYGHAPE
jgi:hypothetical protein